MVYDVMIDGPDAVGCLEKLLVIVLIWPRLESEQKVKCGKIRKDTAEGEFISLLVESGATSYLFGQPIPCKSESLFEPSPWQWTGSYRYCNCWQKACCLVACSIGTKW